MLFVIGLVVGAMVGLVVIGLLMMANDRLRVVGKWKGVKSGVEMIDTSDGHRWIEFGKASGHPCSLYRHREPRSEWADEFVRVLP